MPWQDIAIGLLMAGSGVAGWLLKTLWSAVEALRGDLSKLERALPDVYARRDDVRDMFDRVLQSVEHLRHELREKADK
jgi:hypothetical protein